VLAHPADKVGDVGVAPHPGREALERRLGAIRPGAKPHIAVHHRGVGPVGLDGHDGEAVRSNEMTGDGGSRPVELGGAVAGLAEQHNPLVGEAVEEPSEGGIVEIRQGFGRLRDQLWQALPA
jgi:hypothetical protein